jgi:IPT/TIG domain
MCPRVDGCEFQFLQIALTSAKTPSGSIVVDVTRALLVLLALVAAGCGGTTPTSPITGPGSTPSISAITPTSIKVGAQAQTLTITGSSLQGVTEVLVVSPSGMLRTFTGQAILKLTTTSFEISLPLEEAGRYQLAIIAAPSESASSAFTVST